MAVDRESCVIYKIEKKTPGGQTYTVLLPGTEEPTLLCFRRTGKIDDPVDMRCTKAAGAYTWHPGTGACKFHGGEAGRKIVHGRGSVVARKRLKASVEAYLAEDKDVLMDLTRELAVMKALMDEVLEKFPEDDDKSYNTEIRKLVGLVQATGSLVEKVSKIEARNTLTAAQVLYLRATMIDLFMKWIPEPKDRQRAIDELMHRMGGGKLIDE